MSKPRVLLADDHATITDAVAEILRAEMDVVGKVANGRAAVDAVDQLKPDVVVLDISMPVLDGLDAAREMRALIDPPCIVFLTVYEDPAFASAARDAGAMGYVFKRRVVADLLPAIRQVLGGHPFFPAPDGERTRPADPVLKK